MATADFILAVFEGAVEERFDQPGGSHIEATIGGCPLVLEAADSFPEAVRAGPAAVYLYVPDVDATYARALAAGGESVNAPEDKPYGERGAGVRDPSGNTWWIATHDNAR